MRFRNILVLCGALLLLLGLAACGGKGENVNADGAWLMEAGLDAEESIDELYEKAKKEGKVVVYSTSSIINNVKENFEKQYPGVNVEASKISGVKLIEKLKREQGSGVYNADVIFASDSVGIYDAELTQRGLLHHYKPDVLKEHMVEPYKDSPELSIAESFEVILYNTKAYDESPIHNWWDLTTDEWKGKVLMPNPLDSEGVKALFLAFIRYADDMEQAYEDKFNKKLELNGTDNAGYEFIKQLLENELIIMKSGGEAVNGVTQSSSDKPPVAVGSSVKLRDAVTKGEPVDIAWDVEPKLVVSATKNLWISDQAPNVNAAKLFIRWMSGGEDVRGFEPLNTPGTWSTMDNIQIEDEDIPGLEEMNLWDPDFEFFYENAKKLDDFLIKIQ